MSSVEKPGVGDQLYSGAAELGMFRVTIGLIFGIIFGLAAIIFGLYMAFYKKNVHSVEVHGKIIEIVGTCTSIIDRDNNLQVKCSVKIEYMYNGVSYKPTNTFPTNDGMKSIGQEFTIYIDPNNPSDCSTDSIQNDKKIGWIIFMIGLVFIGLSFLYWWLAQRYKFFAAAEGVGMGIGLMGYGRSGW